MTKGFSDRFDSRYVDVSVGSVLKNLPELMLAHLVSPTRVAIIIEAGGSRYFQFLATEDQHLVLECVSNRYLDDADALSIDEEFRLVEAGFAPPEGEAEPHPNFWWHREGVYSVMEACRLTSIVLREVFGLSDGSRVVVVERPLATSTNP